MSNTIQISFNKQEKERLSRLALNYGLSLADFSRKVLLELHDVVPTECYEDYENPRAVKTAFNRALRHLKAGKIKTKL